MASLDPHLLPDLVHLDPRTFESGIASLRGLWEGTHGEARQNDLLAILRAFADDAGLGATETARRGRLLVEAAQLPESLAVEVARAARSWPSALRSAVVGGLPPALRRLAYDAAAPRAASALTAPESHPPAVVLPFPGPTGRETDRDAALICHTVLLLGTMHEHEDNQALLQRNGFAPY